MRRILLVAGVAALGLTVAFRVLPRGTTAERGLSTEIPQVSPGQGYAVAVDHEQADVDLEFQPDSRYIAVISSLARSTGRFTVAASTRPIAAPECLPQRLSPLSSTNARREPLATASTRVAASDSSRSREAERAPETSRARTFALHVTDGSLDDPRQYAKVAAHEVAHGRTIRVYLDDQQSAKELAPGLVQGIADLFDNELIPRFRDVFGTYRDVDGDGRFSVLLSPWLARLQGGRTSIGGFVRGSDFQSQIAPPFSNRCDMMYVNSQTVPGPHLRTLLIHEYTHAVSFSRRTAVRQGETAFPEEEDWLNEALAHCAESLFGGGWTNLDYRISRYLNDTAAYPLVVDDYYRAGLWRCHGCRGATYLFLRYCVERFGTGLLTRLVAAPARGTRNLELATGCSFDRLFRDWTLSLLERTCALETDKPLDASPPAAASRPPAAQFKLDPLDLCGALGPWGLAGPRPRQWTIDSGSLTIELKGTAAAFVEMSAPRKPGLRRVHFAGTRGMQLQVTLVKLSDDLPQITVDAAWAHRTSAAQETHDPLAGGNQSRAVVRTTVRVARGTDLQIEQIAAEQNAGEDRVPLCFSGDSIKSLEVSVPTSSNVASKSEHPSSDALNLSRVFELPGEQFTSSASPVIIKVVAIDRNGRRATGWATVSQHPPQQVAAARR